MGQSETKCSNSPSLGFQSAGASTDRTAGDVEEEKKDLHVELKERLHLEEEEKEGANEEKGVVIKEEGERGSNGWDDWGEGFRDEWKEEEGVDVGAGKEEEKEKCESRSNGKGALKYPLRAEAEDCAFYVKNGACKFGATCKFNHPVNRNYQAVKERLKERDETSEKPKPGVAECKYYWKTGGCKYGKACRYNHSKAKAPPISAKPSTFPVLELNFLGLPIRLGEKDCPYYMRNGSCQYGANCRFNHPDPSPAGDSDPPMFGNGGPASLQASSQSNMNSWSSPRTLNGAAPFVPIIYSPQVIPPHSPEWSEYQPPVFFPERGVHHPPSYAVNNQAPETNVYRHQQQPKPVEEFPERPGQPDCNHFIKTGDCKFKSNCKFHHPKDRISRSPLHALSDKGLPLRPDQNICVHYSRYGICKFGSACRFNHPIEPAFTGSSDDQHSPAVNSSTDYETRNTGNGNNNATE